MKPIRIDGANLTLKAPDGWDEETNGQCLDLHVRVGVYEDGSKQLLSAWEPLPDELSKLNAGAAVLLSIVGEFHPPVWVAVGDPRDIGAAPWSPNLDELKRVVRWAELAALAGSLEDGDLEVIYRIRAEAARHQVTL